MPASLRTIRGTGALVFLHVCEVCGADASFGVGGSFRLAVRQLEAGDRVSAKRHLGKWYCRQHRPAKTEGPA